MTLDVLTMLLSADTPQVNLLDELANARDQFHQQLQHQLSVNRILCQVSIRQSQLKNKCDSNFKIQEESLIKLEERFQDQVENVKVQFQQINNINKYTNGQANNPNEKMRVKTKNDTKNIPKNYGKAIIKFIQTSPKSRILAKQMCLQFQDILKQTEKWKQNINTIEGLKRMWREDKNIEGGEGLAPINKCLRILSNQFMRKHSLKYIFSSRVVQYEAHIKYRGKLMEGIENAQDFKFIKTY